MSAQGTALHALAGSPPLVALGFLPKRGAPTAFVAAAGCRVEAVDGRRFIDLHNGAGAVLLGHAHPAVTEAVLRAVRAGLAGVASAQEATVAERLLALLPPGQRIRFLKTGSEATSLAVRVARAATGRARVIACGYHGWHDWAVAGRSGGEGVPPAVAALTRRVAHGDAAGLAAALAEAPGEVAAIVAEPLLFEPAPGGWPAALREAADRHGAVLVFDETATFLRIGRGGVQGACGVRPDLTVLGKGLANGLPLTTLAGEAHLMSMLDGRVAALSTTAQEGVALAAAAAVLDVLAAQDVPAALAQAGETLRIQFARAAAATGLSGALSIVGHPARMALVAADETRVPRQLLRALLVQALLERGVYAPAGFAPSLAFNNDAPLREIGAALTAACRDVAAALALPNPGAALRSELPEVVFSLR
jgi:glutamate-1-semialdehyde aminotransferase